MPEPYLAYRAAVQRLLDEYAALPAGTPVRLAKPTSNLFRQRGTASARLHVAAFSGVLALDVKGRTADVLGMTTYEDLVDATLPHGLMPMVVPQLKTITLGGAVTGLGIESTSFRNGCPHESVLDMDVLTGDGRVVTATPDGEHADLFAAFPNSYGTLGYALRLRIELEDVKPFVRLEHRRYHDHDQLMAAMARACDGDRQVDFVDGTVFSPGESYLTLGTFTGEAPTGTSDYTGRDVYYRSVQRRTVDHLTVRDYLWRWDTDWFWCSRALLVQKPAVRRLVPKRYLRSDVYKKVVDLDQRTGLRRRLDAARGRPAREVIVQDVEVPVEHAAELLHFLHRDTGISPLWVCPMRRRDPTRSWPLYPMDPSTLYVNVGFWSSVALAPGEQDGVHNRRIEAEVERLGGRKSLYSTSFYDEAEFWSHYNGSAYELVKKAYDGDARLLDLYSKCVHRG